MDENNDRRELERRLAQVRRLIVGFTDTQTVERLTKLAEEIEGELRAADAARTNHPP